jgi:hypothetical protein
MSLWRSRSYRRPNPRPDGRARPPVPIVKLIRGDAQRRPRTRGSPEGASDREKWVGLLWIKIRVSTDGRPDFDRQRRVAGHAGLQAGVSSELPVLRIDHHQHRPLPPLLTPHMPLLLLCEQPIPPCFKSRVLRLRPENVFELEAVGISEINREVSWKVWIFGWRVEDLRPDIV